MTDHCRLAKLAALVLVGAATASVPQQLAGIH